MLILVVIMIMTMAELVAGAVAAALDGMDEVMLTEQRQSPEHIRLVDGHDPAL
jgi:hypothetical protein